MQRRDFFGGFGSLVAMTGLWVPTQVVAQAKAPQAGTDFKKLDKPVPVEAPAGKVEVVEFFGYFCKHCNAFEPALAAWLSKLPKDVAFKRVPVAFTDESVPQQRLFYALEAMGLVDKLHARVFAAIHVEKQSLNKADAIVDWAVKQGVDKAKFVENFNAFNTYKLSTKAKQLANAYQIEGVPTLGVAGRSITDGSMAKSMERALQVADYLIAQARSAR